MTSSDGFGDARGYPLPVFFDGEDSQKQELAGRAGSTGGQRGRLRGRSAAGHRGRGRSGAQRHLRTCSSQPNLLTEKNDDAQNENSNRGRNSLISRGRRGRGRGAENRPESRNRESGSIIQRRDSRSDMGANNISDLELELGSEDVGQRTERKPRKFSEMELVTLSKKENPDEVLLDIGNSRSGFSEFIRKPVEPELLYYVVRLLCNVSDAKQNLTRRREILQEVEKHFLYNLTELLNLVSLKDRKTLQIWKSPSNLSRLLINICRLLCVVITTLPSSLGKCKGVITAVKEVIEEHEVEGVEDALRDVEEVLLKVKQAKENLRPEDTLYRVFKSSPQTEEELQFPPNNFREIPIFPSLEDLQENLKPFLRSNKPEGKYDGLGTYLDVQFRLLREDYIQPLRKGISEYRHCVKQGIAVTKLRDIRLYHSLQILHPVCSGRGINHVLQFDITSLKRVNWAASRRLLYGSLVCLSKDHFETMLYATITDREISDLAQGNVQVYFENKSDLLEIRPNDVFTMAETTAYFEAYRHVLEGLKETDVKLPFQRYIIQCETSIRPPSYLLKKEHSLYDFSCLLPESCENALIPVLQERYWPSPRELKLDSSQYEALQQAITKELAIIQGPPGTGKTFMGLKITELLLSNTDHWTDVGKKCPILVVCYTNHALDQFLEGVSHFSKGQLVRIGGRCKNEHLEPYILRNIKQRRKENKERSFSVTQSERDYRRELKNSESMIDLVSTKLKQTTTKVVQYGQLLEYMTKEQQVSFESKMPKKQNGVPFLQTITEDQQHFSERRILAEWLELPQDDTEELTDELKIEEKYKRVWEKTILQTVQELPRHEREEIICPWDLDTGRRAELYKAWVSELTEVLQDKFLSEDARSTNKRSGQFKLEEVIQKSKEAILDNESLLKHIISPKTRLEIQLLNAGRRVSDHNLIRYWLDLLGNKKSIPYIQEALKNLAINEEKNKQNAEQSDEEEDLEEERELDEDDYFLLDYSAKKEKEHNKRPKGNDEWILNVNAKQTAYKVKLMLNGAKRLSTDEAEGMKNVWKLERSKRRDLYVYWILQYRQKLKDKVKLQEDAFSNATEKLEDVRNMETVEIMKEADVIGMTTTGAAKYRKLLKMVKTSIIIVEEAAEVLESHIVTTLNENCQHLILIGDHKQLRPSTTVYELSKKYQMDVSLFERMVRNKVPCVTLQEQHRMRPEISCLLRNERLYPTLRDHGNVLKYENIQGVDMNVQFIDHEEPEMTPEDSTSHCNAHEAQYVAKLCQYFLNQGYKPLQITVITPYMAQVLLLRREMPKSTFEGVRITAVDNFQGEENDIIILSLVRSSSNLRRRQENKIGFVGIENRICVALSRAKKGLYVLGNSNLLEENSELWFEIIRLMRRNGAVKPELKLICQNHPNQFVLARVAQDFEKFPEGGCGQSCGAKLPCGHKCPKSCHPVDREHLRTICDRPCEKIVCFLGHKCTKRCRQDCGECCAIVEKVVPLCGHKTKMKCHINPNDWECTQTCGFILTCGHQCNRKCCECKKSGKHEEKCKEEVIRLLSCNHRVAMKCHVSEKTFLCQQPCEATLECGHSCKGNCSSCLRGMIHAQCQGNCEKALPCGHKCSYPCSEVCPPCNRPCEWKCSHKYSCKNKCYQECTKCEEPCNFNCNHQKCEKSCHEPCANRTCEVKCTKKLDCGHICRSLCGERCTCTVCQKNLIRNDFGETFDEGAIFIQLPDCRCILEIHRLDRHMKSTTSARQGSLCKICPHCSRPIRNPIKRYTNILKEVRGKIVDKYRRMFGSDNERRLMARNIQIKIQILRQLGLSDTKSKALEMAISDINKFGVLQTTERVVEKLQTLLSFENTWKQYSNIDLSEHGFITATSLQDVLIHMRKYPSKQFWKEIDTEIKRLKFGQGLLAVRDSLSHQKTLQELIQLALRMLTLECIDHDKENLLKEVFRTVRRYIETTVVDNSLIEELKFKLSEMQKLQQAEDEIKKRRNGSGTSEDRESGIQDKLETNKNTNKCVQMEVSYQPHKNTAAANSIQRETAMISDERPDRSHVKETDTFATATATHTKASRTPVKRTPEFELALGSDSIDSPETPVRTTTQTNISSDILLSSDSFDSSSAKMIFQRSQTEATSSTIRPTMNVLLKKDTSPFDSRSAEHRSKETHEVDEKLAVTGYLPGEAKSSIGIQNINAGWQVTESAKGFRTKLKSQGDVTSTTLTSSVEKLQNTQRQKAVNDILSVLEDQQGIQLEDRQSVDSFNTAQTFKYKQERQKNISPRTISAEKPEKVSSFESRNVLLQSLQSHATISSDSEKFNKSAMVTRQRTTDESERSLPESLHSLKSLEESKQDETYSDDVHTRLMQRYGKEATASNALSFRTPSVEGPERVSSTESSNVFRQPLQSLATRSDSEKLNKSIMVAQQRTTDESEGSIPRSLQDTNQDKTSSDYIYKRFVQRCGKETDSFSSDRKSTDVDGQFKPAIPVYQRMYKVPAETDASIALISQRQGRSSTEALRQKSLAERQNKQIEHFFQDSTTRVKLVQKQSRDSSSPVSIDRVSVAFSETSRSQNALASERIFPERSNSQYCTEKDTISSVATAPSLFNTLAPEPPSITTALQKLRKTRHDNSAEMKSATSRQLNRESQEEAALSTVSNVIERQYDAGTDTRTSPKISARYNTMTTSAELDITNKSLSNAREEFRSSLYPLTAFQRFSVGKVEKQDTKANTQEAKSESVYYNDFGTEM